MTGTYRFADKAVLISTQYPDTHRYCQDYRVDTEAEIIVETDETDIDREIERSPEGEGHSFSRGYLETLAVYRRIAEKMVEYDTFLFHGSAVAVEGEAYLFTASSGTGKSTHTRLWRQLLGDRAVMVSDDKPLIRADGSTVRVFGTPYNGKHRLGCDMSAILKAVCILERSKDNHIEEIDAAQAYPMLIQQTYRPDSPLGLMKTMELIDRLASGVKLYRLGCNMDISAAKIAYEAMKG